MAGNSSNPFYSSSGSGGNPFYGGKKKGRSNEASKTGGAAQKRKQVAAELAKLKARAAQAGDSSIADKAKKALVHPDNPVMMTLRALATPGSLVLNTLGEVGDMAGMNNAAEGDEARFSAMDLLRDTKNLKGAGDYIKEMNGGTGTGSKWADRALGFTGDVVLDPTTYLTGGVSAVGKGVAGGAAKSTVRLTARQAALRIAEEGTDKSLREADRLLLRGANEISPETALRNDLKLGYRFGTKNHNVDLGQPGETLFRAGAEAKGAIKEAAGNTKVAEALRKKFASTPLPDSMITGKGGRAVENPRIKKVMFEEARRTAKGQAKRRTELGRRQLSDLAASYQDVDGNNLLRELEGEATGDARAKVAAEAMRGWYRQRLADVEHLTGHRLSERENYAPWMMTRQAREMAEDAGVRPGPQSAPNKRRTYAEDDGTQKKFFGRTLVKDGTPAERRAQMNEIFKEEMGADFEFFEGNPWLLAERYLGGLERYNTNYGTIRKLAQNPHLAKAPRWEQRLIDAAAAAEKEKLGKTAKAEMDVAVKGIKERDRLSEVLDRVRPGLQAIKSLQDMADSDLRSSARTARAGQNVAMSAVDEEQAAREALEAFTPEPVNTAGIKEMRERLATLRAQRDEVPAEIEETVTRKAGGGGRPSPTFSEGFAARSQQPTTFNPLWHRPRGLTDETTLDEYIAAVAAPDLSDLQHTVRSAVVKAGVSPGSLTEDAGYALENLPRAISEARRVVDEMAAGKFDDRVGGNSVRHAEASLRALEDMQEALQLQRQGGGSGREAYVENMVRKQVEKATKRRGGKPPTMKMQGEIRRNAEELYEQEVKDVRDRVDGLVKLLQEEQEKAIVTKPKGNQLFEVNRLKDQIAEAEAAGRPTKARTLQRRLDTLLAEEGGGKGGVIKLSTGKVEKIEAQIKDELAKLSKLVEEEKITEVVRKPNPKRAEVEKVVAEAEEAFRQEAQRIEDVAVRNIQQRKALEERYANASVRRRQRLQHAMDLRARVDRNIAAAKAHREAGDNLIAQVAELEARRAAAEASAIEAGIKAMGAEEASRKLQSHALLPNVEAMYAKGLQKFAQGFPGEASTWSEPWLVQAAKDMDSFYARGGAKGFIKHFDWLTSRWKAYALLSPGFHVRNFLGGVFNNSLAGVDAKSYDIFAKNYRRANAGKWNEIPVAYRQAFRDMLEDGILDDVHARDIADISGESGGGGLLGHGLRKVDPTSLENGVLSLNYNTAGSVERMLRGPLYIDRHLKTGRRMEAMDAVVTYHFDYDDLSRFERETVKRIIPFYTWTRKNFPLQVEHMIHTPGKYTRYLHAKENMEMWEEEEEVVPSYVSDLMGIHTPFQTSGDGSFFGGSEKADVYYTPDLPFRDLSEVANVGTVAGMLNPFLKMPIESLTNTKLSEGFRPMGTYIREAPADPAWKSVLIPMAKMQGVPGVPKIIEKDGRYFATEKELNKIEQSLPLLSKLRRVYPTEKKYQDRALSSYLSIFLGQGTITNTSDVQFGESSRQLRILQGMNRTASQVEKAAKE